MRLLFSTISFSFLAVSASAENYLVDNSHTAIIWEVSHVGYSKTIGRFKDFEVSIAFDENAPGNSNVQAVIHTSSVDSGVEALNNSLLKEDFFHVDQFPTATFQSTGIELVDENTAKVTGDLQLLGVEKPIVLDVVLNKRGVFNGSPRMGFSARTEINRAEWGMDYGLSHIGETVTIRIETEVAVR